MTRPLEGIKVVEWTIFLAGPRCGAHLADWGADVIKIEHPRGGDPTRAPTPGVLPSSGQVPWGFHMENRGKRGITVDLSSERGQHIVHQLIKSADVFLANYQYQALRRFHLDYETLSNLNPRLIYALLTAWGTRGPDKDRPGFDHVVFARSGLMHTLGEPGTPLVVPPHGFGDRPTAMALFGAISLALYHRERTGQGQMVDASILSAEIDFGAANLMTSLNTGVPVPRVSRREVKAPLSNSYQSRDGHWLQFHYSHSDHFWPQFCQFLDIQEYEHDPRFSDHGRRTEHYLELTSIIEKAMASRTKQEWIERFKGGDLIWAFVTPFEELPRDPQLWANDYFIEVDDPAVGKMKMIGPAVHMSRTPAEVHQGGPELGQHTEEVLLELGYSWDDIAALKDEGVIG